MHIPSRQEAQIRFFDNIYRACVTKEKPKLPSGDPDRGTRVIETEAECEKYIAFYGGHHYHKLYAAFNSTNFAAIQSKNVEIVDWGCGQALATCILIDYLIENQFDFNIVSITLVEPSSVALQRGCYLLRQMFQNNSNVDSIIKIVNKYMDDLTVDDLVSEANNIKIHLLSNIIDVDKFDLYKLYGLIVRAFSGTNRLICTSPDNERKNRLDIFYNLFAQSHQVFYSYSYDEAIRGEVFFAKSGRYEERSVGRYERQFTVRL